MSQKAKLGDYLTGNMKMVNVIKKDGKSYIAMKGMNFNTDVEIDKEDVIKINDGKWHGEAIESKPSKPSKPKKKKKGGK